MKEAKYTNTLLYCNFFGFVISSFIQKINTIHIKQVNVCLMTKRKIIAFRDF